MRLGGWLRLWIVVSLLYLVLVILSVVLVFPEEHFRLAFLWWIIPVIGIYVLGWAVGWVYRGFRSQ